MLGILWLSCLVMSVRSTVDLNERQIQHIADHLTLEECRQLAEALQYNTYRLPSTPSEKYEPNIPCLWLLEEWTEGEGQHQTFQLLSLRLQEIGRPDLANKLSSIVFHEAAEKVQHDFLDDPFKAFIHTDSPILDIPPAGQEGTSLDHDPFSSPWQPWHTACVVISVACLLMSVTIIWVKVFPHHVPHWPPCVKLRNTVLGWYDGMKREYQFDMGLLESNLKDEVSPNRTFKHDEAENLLCKHTGDSGEIEI